MKCPYCNQDMQEGVFTRGFPALKWVSNKNDQGVLNKFLFVKGIKLMDLEDSAIRVFHCDYCKKFIIDEENMKIKNM